MKRHSTSLFNRGVARGIVILLLAYAAVDISNPQLCNEEFTAGPVVVAAAEMRDPVESAADAVGASENSRQEQPPIPHTDEDCFCCCIHVLPAVIAHSTGSSDVTARQVLLTEMLFASADRNQPYHPPRVV